MSQKTSTPVSAEQARQIGTMFEDFARRYPGGREKIELVKGDTGLEAAFHALCDERAALRAQTITVTKRPTWKTVTLGTHGSNTELRQYLTDVGFRIGAWGGDILNKTPVSREPSELNLVLVTGTDLGFSDGTLISNLYTKAISLGLSLCPAEVGPQLRLQYPNQAPGNSVIIAMEPIVDINGNPCVFTVNHDSGGRWLWASYCPAVGSWHVSNRWVFCRK